MNAKCGLNKAVLMVNIFHYYVYNYICSRFESWTVHKLSRLDSLNVSLIIAGYQD